MVNKVDANGYPAPRVDINLLTPENKTYQDNSVLVMFTASQFHYQYVAYYYELDYGGRKVVQNITTTLEMQYPKSPPFPYKEIVGNFSLDNLSEGRHTITVYCSGDFKSRDFFIDTPPVVSLLPIENTTSDSPNIQLNFTVNQPISKIQYDLDGLGNQTISGNTTLTNLSIGLHNVTIYAWDKNGNIGKSELQYFTVINDEPSPDELYIQSAALPVTAATAAIAFAIVGLLVYSRKQWSGKLT